MKTYEGPRGEGLRVKKLPEVKASKIKTYASMRSWRRRLAHRAKAMNYVIEAVEGAKAQR